MFVNQIKKKQIINFIFNEESYNVTRVANELTQQHNELTIMMMNNREL